MKMLLEGEILAAGFDELIGQTISGIYIRGDNDQIVFHIDSNRSYCMFHNQDCCEDVAIENIDGDIEDLVVLHFLPLSCP